MVFPRTKGIISHLELEGGEGWEWGIPELNHEPGASIACVLTWTPKGAARSWFNFT